MDRTAWVALSLTERVGSKTLRALLAHFQNDLNAVLQADEAALRDVPGVGAKTAQNIAAIDRAQVEAWMAEWDSQGIALLTSDDEGYPPALRETPDAPPTLFMRGAVQFTQAVAVVGRRSPTPQAREIAHEIGRRLAGNGMMVVSGLARGIDTAAHQGALAAGGCTVAVLGCGVNQIYPPENEGLAAQIIECGAVLSEVAPSAPPSTSRLVARNRIISGLCQAVIVVETEEDGGAMHAAKRAREQGRRVGAIKLPASGNEKLIYDGALALETDLSNLAELL